MENVEDENKKRRASEQAISGVDAKRIKVGDEEASIDDDAMPKKERWQGEYACMHAHDVARCIKVSIESLSTHSSSIGGRLHRIGF
jgi:hypothetical protein